MIAPVAKKIPEQLPGLGEPRIDPYYWMKNREDPRVIEHLREENAYTGEVLKDVKKLREKLYDEITGRIKKQDESVPFSDNGYYYYHRFREGYEYPLHCRKKGSLDAPEEIMLDVNRMARGHDYIHVTGLSVSGDNRYLAYGVDTLGRRKYTICIKDLFTGKVLSDHIPVTTGYAAWSAGNRIFFYTVKDENTLRPFRICRHRIGRDVNSDPVVYEESDETFHTHAYKTKSRNYIMIVSSGTLSDEYRFLDAGNPHGDFRIIQPRRKKLEYSPHHFGDAFYIVTNNKAKNFRLMKTPVHSPSMDNWTEVIPHRKNVLLRDIEIFSDYLVVSERKSGLTGLQIIRWDDGNSHHLDFGEEVYVAGISTNRETDTRFLRYSYSSLTTPNSILDYNMETREKTLRKQQEIIGDFRPDDYESRRIYATARDGRKVPVSMVYRKGMKLNGKNPLLLHAYGSYGITIEPYFSSVRLSLLDRGFIFAIAHVRGGQIYGRQWYEDGKLLNKKNTFHDFIDCSRFLIQENYTRPDRLVAMGGSAGGLLIGAVLNMRPDLYRGAIAAVPFVDVVTTMLDRSIPLTTSEYDEWGNPEDPRYYEYMLSYSPYDNVRKTEYPAILVTAGLHDSQVQYWEPAKWVAKLREMNRGKQPILLHTNMDAGHGGVSGRFRKYRETALEYAFILKLLGRTR